MIIYKDISIDLDIEATPKEFFGAKLKWAITVAS